MNQTIASVSELAPGDTYSRELGGPRHTVESLEPWAPDPFGRPTYYINHERGSSRLLLANDDVWRDH